MSCALFSSSPAGERKPYHVIKVRNETVMKDVLDGGLFFLRELLFGFNFFLKLKDFLIFQLPTITIL